jgi:hypothetical protein
MHQLYRAWRRAAREWAHIVIEAPGQATNFFGHVCTILIFQLVLIYGQFRQRLEVAAKVRVEGIHHGGRFRLLKFRIESHRVMLHHNRIQELALAVESFTQATVGGLK